MGSNQSIGSQKKKETESLVIEEDDKAFVKRLSGHLIIETVEHVTKSKMSRQDKEGIQHAIRNGDQKSLSQIIKKLVSKDKRDPFSKILVDIDEETNHYSAVDWTGLVLGGLGGGAPGIVVGAECGAILGPGGVLAGGILGGILGAIMGAYVGLKCARLISWLCQWLGEIVKSLIHSVCDNTEHIRHAVGQH